MAMTKAYSSFRGSREPGSNLASIVAGAGRPSQKVRLSQALAEFSKLLSDEEAVDYQYGVGTSSPTVEEILQLTRNIEEKAKGQRNQYVTRFWNFLEMVRGITGVVDIIVGGSQSIIACSTWAVVKFTLQVGQLNP